MKLKIDYLDLDYLVNGTDNKGAYEEIARVVNQLVDIANGDVFSYDQDPDQTKSFLRSTLDEYVRELIPKKKDVFDHEEIVTGTLEAIKGYNQAIDELLKQHEENIRESK